MRASRAVRWTMIGLFVAAAGCGDDDSDTTNKQEWVAAADAICVDMNAQLDDIAEPASLEEFEAAQNQVKQVWTQGLADLDDLGLPADDEAAAAEVMEAFDELATVSFEWSDAFIEAGSPAEMTPEVEALFRELEAAAANATRLADAYGLEHCFTDQDQ